MPNRNENYPQDRLGNTNRELDQLRSQEGMAGADDDDEGIVTIAAGDVDSDVIVYELPTHADQVILDLVHAHNSTDASGTFQLFSATLDSGGSVNATTRRSVPVNVSDGVTRTIGYEGIPFSEDAIVVNSGFEGDIGIAVLSDHDQSSEPASEQTS